MSADESAAASSAGGPRGDDRRSPAAPPQFGSVEVAARPSPDGLLDVTVSSPSLGRRGDVTLFAPRGVDGGAALPLVVLLHGVYGSHFAWARSGAAHVVLQALVDDGLVRPMVLAMPSDGLFGIGSGYVAGPHGDVEAWVVDEVPAVARLVHPGAGAGGTAVAGLSMGGWGALRLAARRPGAYRAAAGMSPLTRWEQVEAYADEAQRPQHRYPVDRPDLAEQLLAAKAELPALRITCGTEDALLGDVRALHAMLDREGIDHEYDEAHGGHEWPVWERELRSSLLFIDGHL